MPTSVLNQPFAGRSVVAKAPQQSVVLCKTVQDLLEVDTTYLQADYHVVSVESLEGLAVPNTPTPRHAFSVDTRAGFIPLCVLCLALWSELPLRVMASMAIVS